ncbi:MAG: transposase [Ilumatobacter sp.]|nr:transposase [Ilumatobacter sp.]
MARAPRSNEQHGWHHVMNRGVARGDTFFADCDRVEFGRCLGDAAARFGVEIHAYCLMPNHFHLVVNCPDGNLSAFMQLLVSVYTRHVNDRVGRDGPIFRGRFRSRMIANESYLRAAVRYVHRNALALPHVASVEQYRWSSHRAYLGLRRSPGWLEVDTLLSMFGDDLERFHGFVAGDDAPITRAPDPDRLRDAAWLVTEEIMGDVGRAPQGLAKTVLHLALDQREPGLTSPALRRARRQARLDPRLIEAARRALALAA